jgi:hypothetical protein
MSHQVCRDVTSWIEPIKEQVEECIRRECNWYCLCCNKWLCSLVWVVVVAGRYVTETVCEVVSDIADAVVAGAKAGLKFLGGLLGAVANPEDINKALGMHLIEDSAEEGGLSKNHSIPLVGGNCAKKYASAFNNAEVASGTRYIDSGVRYSYRINDNEEILFRVGRSTERLVEHRSDKESDGTPVENQSGQLGIHFVEKRAGQLIRGLKFDLIAASGNRAFVREKDTANFYFASMKHEFVNQGPASLGQGRRGADVPGVYATLDAEHGQNLLDIPPNPATNSRYEHHPSLKAFEKYSDWMIQPIASRIYEGLLIVKVFPRVWHKLDTRPPFDSGSPPWFVDTFDHVTYEGAFGLKKTYKSIKIYGVLDIGVGHTHRVLHHETKYGDEVDTMNKYAYPAIAGPIEDGGGFCDGMCNFYVLCKIKVRPIPGIPAQRETYAILWIDEQTYFCERWRLVGFEDGDCNTLRAWGIAGVYSAHNAKSLFYWSPFETSWRSDPSHITDASRLAVAKHTLVVNGVGPVSTLHPDNTDETPPSVTVFSPVLYSTNYSFATSDKTWRWRGYPCRVASGCEWAETATGPTCYPETVKIREDMTIYLRGENADGVRGYWYQKYLPADNTPVRHMNVGMPHYSYTHGWSFAEQNVFEAADQYSHFGVHKMDVDSRSQYYLLDIVDEDALPEDVESLPWRDEEERLFWFYVTDTKYSPSPYNHGSFFRILDRRPLGFIAVWWDKRDDELPEVNRIGFDLKLTQFQGEDDGASIFTRIFDRRRKLSPPVVQCAKVSVKVREGVVEEFSLRFYTRMFDNWDLESPTPDEPNDGLDWNFVAEDSSIRDYVARHTPDYLPHDDDPTSRPTFKPDTTIFKARITVENSGTVVTIFDEKIANAFSRRSRYEYVHEWQRSSSGQRHPHEADLLQYCAENAAALGTSVWFEDIIGHVATPERTIFDFHDGSS